ncbi:heat shock 70 kDa protein 12B-like [Mytilus californianus]|uniref:heat shock 70 kDa protein 12B-like n=1 Tax=Mytilus californianus TaxID=6549 RepID=UPI00224731A8|nr:heat shock 70 kDa protein 12B-like [Mytilus californianus]
MACAEVVSEPLLVAAIDFGTTFSGYAFQTLRDFKEDPLRIHGFSWTTGSNAGLSLKTPTCVLFDPAQNFYSFGVEAEDKYTELAQEEDHANWYYFRRFKMNLYKSQDIPRDLMLEDDKGKLLPAMKVISESIKFMREHLMRTLGKKGQDVIRPSEIHWVLTVPAIWSDAAKQFMREAAVKGGIPNSQLMLALEPESASIYCKHIPSERMVCGGKSTLDAFSPGTKYLILDAGGGTIDITVQEVQTDGTIKQLYMANGGDWGGTKVDEAFEEFLVDLLGAPAISRFREDDKAGHLDLLREFEIKKRSIKPDSLAKVTFKVPISLKEAHEKETGKDLKESMSRSSKRVAWVGDKLRMEADSARELFKSPCDYITTHLEEIFGDPKVRGTNIILMVGGFSDSPMLRDAVESAFPEKIIIIPDEAGLAVLKGAVQFGFEPRIISSRICKATYGVKTNSPFKEGVDPEDKKVIEEGDVLCSDRFSRHVEIGQPAGIDEEFKEQVYVPCRSNQTAMRVEIWTSLHKNPRYTTDPGCMYHGELNVQMPDTTGGKNREVGVKMIFGRTELQVRAVNKTTGDETKAEFDFLR